MKPVPGFTALHTVDCCSVLVVFVNSNLNLNPMSLDVDSAAKNV